MLSSQQVYLFKPLNCVRVLAINYQKEACDDSSWQNRLFGENEMITSHLLSAGSQDLLLKSHTFIHIQHHMRAEEEIP